MTTPLVEDYDEILRSAGFKITLTPDSILEIRMKMYESFVIAHSFNNSTIDDKNSLCRRLVRQPSHSKMCALIEAQAKVWKKFG
jgi:hypothetical protein